MAAEALLGFELDQEEYVELLRKLISHTEQLQNNPTAGQVPKEDLASDHVLEVLAPYNQEAGGPLKVERVTYLEGRGNVMITYPGKTDRTVAFVGSHLDVVPALPEDWDTNPFELTVDGDKLYGRGTTDCLGHVAMLTLLFKTLAVNKPELDVTVVGVMIASEEAESYPVKDAGVESLVKEGRLEHLKAGPVIWIDSADSQPCIGTAGAIQWTLKAEGKLFHSGLPHKGINALEMVMESLKIVQDRFYEAFPPHPDEKKWLFSGCSTMKPTQVDSFKGSINQIPAWTEIKGDIRLTPFYDCEKVKSLLEEVVAGLNADVTKIPTRGPLSKYTLPDEDRVGKLTLTWGDHYLTGVACDTSSPGFFALLESTEEVTGSVKPYSICGSLPLVREMQQAGFDLQITGFGKSAVYHGDNEYCSLSDMVAAFKILSRIIAKTNDEAWMKAADEKEWVPEVDADGA